MDIDIYDFDKTIVPFDSGSLFIAYCMIHYPWTVITLPVVAVGLVLGFVGMLTFTQYKKFCFCLVRMIPLKKAVKGFWDKYEKKVHPWFYQRKRYSVVISASPDFLLDEIQQRLGFDELICTRHNSKTGAIIGENCRGREKVNRLYQLHKKEDINVIDVYSDSIKHDKPIFSLATGQCYHIVKGSRNKIDYTKTYG